MSTALLSEVPSTLVLVVALFAAILAESVAEFAAESATSELVASDLSVLAVVAAAAAELSLVAVTPLEVDADLKNELKPL